MSVGLSAPGLDSAPHVTHIEGMQKTLMHYSVPGLSKHKAQTADLSDARDMARRMVSMTGTHAAILAHYAEDGKEVVEAFEVIAP